MIFCGRMFFVAISRTIVAMKPGFDGMSSRVVLPHLLSISPLLTSILYDQYDEENSRANTGVFLFRFLCKPKLGGGFK